MLRRKRSDRIPAGTCILAALSLSFSAPLRAADGPIQPAWIPPAVERGLDMFMAEEEAVPQEPELATAAFSDEEISWSGAALDLLRPMHPLYTEYRRQLGQYQQTWGGQPQVRIPAGAVMRPGSADRRVAVLRRRLGLGAGGFDQTLKDRVTAYQRVHGLAPDGIATADTIRSLNRGARYYERLILLSMERVRRLPAEDAAGRYILVDAASARLWMYEDRRPVDSMKVIVGTPESETPMMAAMIRYGSVNPYWNVPTDLVQKLIAPRVLAEGAGYLASKGYEVLESWREDAKAIDPATVDWKSVVDGRLEPRVRQLPGEGNFMGQIKFMMPNEFGVYLHDTPAKHLFGQKERWLSNGCVRLEDAPRLARWLFGAMPVTSDRSQEQRFALEKPVPVYITYLTAGIEDGALTFRRDAYARDAQVLARFAGEEDGMRDADPLELVASPPPTRQRQVETASGAGKMVLPSMAGNNAHPLSSSGLRVADASSVRRSTSTKSSAKIVRRQAAAAPQANAR